MRYLVTVCAVLVLLCVLPVRANAEELQTALGAEIDPEQGLSDEVLEKIGDYDGAVSGFGERALRLLGASLGKIRELGLEEIVSGIEKGLLVGGFSGGQPGTNGEFSGVAKNSFLIENGRVTRAVTETMINGNLGDMLRHVRGISREWDVQGVFTLPYLAVDGIVISGK